MVDLSALQNLTTGDLFGFINSIYTTSMGSAPFVGFLLMILTIPIYQRTESLELVAVIWLLIWAPMEIMVPGPIFSLGKIMIAMSLGVLIFRAFMGRGHHP